MKATSGGVLLLLLQATSLVPEAAAEENKGEYKHFINWDAHEYPIVPGWNRDRPFPDNGEPPMGFEAVCNNIQTFYAKNYKLADLRRAEDHPLYPFSDAIEKFIAGRTYPGSWDGVDHGGLQRDILMMDWRAVPKHVRQWIETEEMRRPAADDGRRWRFLVFHKRPRKVATTQTETATLGPVPTDGVDTHEWAMPKVSDRDKVVVFAPAQIYPILPLWVAGSSQCEAVFGDLFRFQPQAKDDAVVAWPVEHSKPDEHSPEIYFKIRAEHVSETEHGRDRRMLWDTIMRHARRVDRKMTREERRRAREQGLDVPDEDDGVPVRDEL